jgi:hypothetical protein
MDGICSRKFKPLLPKIPPTNHGLGILHGGN